MDWKPLTELPERRDFTRKFSQDILYSIRGIRQWGGYYSFTLKKWKVYGFCRFKYLLDYEIFDLSEVLEIDRSNFSEVKWSYIEDENNNSIKR